MHLGKNRMLRGGCEPVRCVLTRLQTYPGTPRCVATQILSAMLELDPRKRWTCKEAGDVVKKMIATEQKARERSSSPLLTSPSASAAPAGPKSASPTERNNKLAAAKEQSPLTMVVSPERDLPGRAIPSCYSQFSESRGTRLTSAQRRDSSSSNSSTVSAAGNLTGGSPVRPSTGMSPVRVPSAEHNLQNALNERRMSMVSRVRTKKLDSCDVLSNTAKGRPHTEFGRTKSRSLSPTSRAHAGSPEEEGGRDRSSGRVEAGAAGFEERASRSSKRVPKFERTPSREAPDRVEGNFVDRMNPTQSRRTVETASAPAAVADGMAGAAAAAGRFLQRRSDRSPLAGRPKTSTLTHSLSRSPVRLPRNVESGGGATTAKRLSTAGSTSGAKTLMRTCEVKPLQRTCEGESNRFGR